MFTGPRASTARSSVTEAGVGEHSLNMSSPQIERIIPLSDLSKNIPAKIHALNGDKDQMDLLSAMGLSVGSTIEVKRKGDPTIVVRGATRIGVMRALAKLIDVSVCDEPSR